MSRRSILVPWLAVSSFVFAVVAACSSDEHRVTLAPPSEGGASGNGGSRSSSGASGADNGVGGGSLALAGAAGASNEAGAGGSAGGFDQPPQIVSAFGCFAQTGDGLDRLSNGQQAATVDPDTYGPPCGLAWVSDNVNAFAPEQTPTTIVMRRTFVVDPAILVSGTFSVSFKADDAVDLVLNGHAIGSCAPPDSGDNAGACQQACTSVTLPTSLLLGDGQINTLDVRVINLFSISVDGTNFGYTGVSYSLCVAEPSTP